MEQARELDGNWGGNQRYLGGQIDSILFGLRFVPLGLVPITHPSALLAGRGWGEIPPSLIPRLPPKVAQKRATVTPRKYKNRPACPRKHGG